MWSRIPKTCLLKGATYFIAAAASSSCARAQNAAPPRPDVSHHVPVAIHYTLPKAGRVSLNIYDAKGAIVRELLHAATRSIGLNNETWDGNDRTGKPCPLGDYSWKLLETQGLKAKYLLSLGSSYVPDPGAWWGMGPGCHATPGAVAVDGTGMYVAANTTENIETDFLKQTLDGSRRLWSARHPVPWDGATAMAVAGGRVYMLGHNSFYDDRIAQYGLNAGFSYNPQSVWIYDANSGGRPATPVSGNCAGAFNVRWDPADRSKDGKTDAEATDLDASGATVVVAYQSHDAVRWYDGLTGVAGRNVKVTAPEGVAIAADGTVYVSTGSDIVKILPGEASAVPFARTSGHLTRLSVDNSNHTLLAYDAKTAQVERYNRDGAALVTSYGRAGGRATGLYNPADFNGVSDVTSDGAGGFYVAEMSAAPRRVAHLDGKGQLIREWYGGTKWAPCPMVDPDRAATVWLFSNNSDPALMRLNVDYEHKTWKVHSTYNYFGQQPAGAFTDPDPTRYELFKHNGVTYIAPCTALPRVLRMDEKHWRLLPVTVCDVVSSASAAVKGWAGTNQSYQWNDLNGDGIIQRAEVTFYAASMNPHYVCDPHVDKLGQYTMLAGGSPQADGTMYRRGLTWKGDVPVYQMPDATALFTTPLRMRGAYDPRWQLDLFNDTTTGDLYCGMNQNVTGWCANSDAFLGKWKGGTTEVWEVGGRADGSTDHFRRFVGRTHGCSVLLNVAVEGPPNSNSRNNRSYVWDSDGLWVGGVMDSIDTGAAPAWFYDGGAEWLTGTLFTNPKTGRVVLYAPWTNEVRAYEITDWDGWVRQSGALTLGPLVVRD